jgi:hypothetical protein
MEMGVVQVDGDSGEREMGTFRVRCKVEDVSDRSRFAVLSRMLVDTGSGHTWVPGGTLERIGIQREKKVRDGQRPAVDSRRKKLVAAGPLPAAACGS